MTRRILVAGSGKMGANVGLFFARQGWRVCWLSRDPDRLARLERRTRRWLKRILADLPHLGQQDFQFSLLGGPEPLAAELALEAVQEDEAAKSAALGALEALAGPGARLLSTTSSLLPGEIHPRCVVSHFFYPQELTGLVELVPGPATRPADMAALQALFAGCGLRVVPETHEAAFFVNRMLLPLQNECLRALGRGVPGARVDQASASSPLLPVGQLSLMDSVGLDTVHAAARRFISRLGPGEAEAYRPLEQGLARQLAQGRRGRKEGGGLLDAGPQAPGPGVEPSRGPDLGPCFRALALNSLHHLLDRGHCSLPTLDLVLRQLFGVEQGLCAAGARGQALEAVGELRRQLLQTGLPYFRPARTLLQAAGMAGPGAEDPPDPGPWF